MNNRVVLFLLILIIASAAACRPEAAVPTLAPTIDAPTQESADTALDDQEGDPGGADEQRSEVKAAEQPDDDGAVSQGNSETAGINDEQTGAQDDKPLDVQTGPADREIPDIVRDYADIELRWLAVGDGSGQNSLVVNDPTLYAIEFNDDGTFVYRADCNMGGGTFVQDGNQLSLDLGTVTLSACSDDSLADQYIQYLRDVESVESTLNELFLDLAGGASQMILSQGISVEPESVEVGITGVEWLWNAFSDPVEGQLTIKESGDYSITLMPGGKALVMADCNQVDGVYSLDESAISIIVEVGSSENCGPDSNWESFIEHLNAVAIYFVQDEDLFIDLIYDSGTMRFEHGGFIIG